MKDAAMTESEIRTLVERTATAAAQEAVKETLLKLGIRADDALEVQADMQHLRQWRESMATVKRQSLMTAVGILVAGFLGLLWMAVKGG
jgi:hypothetical protein